jgi:hypothetical protein
MFRLETKKLLALITLCFFLVVILVLFFAPIPKDNLDLVKTTVTSLITAALMVVSYYFGSSEGSSRKTELMAPPSKAAEDAAWVETKAPANAGFTRLPVLLFLFAAFACAIVITGGCATSPPVSGGAGGGTVSGTPMETAGKSLLAVKSTLVVTAVAVDGLCQAEKLSIDTCTRAKVIYEVAKPAYDDAVDAYLLMSQGGDPAAFAATLQRVQSLANSILTISGTSGATPLVPVSAGGAK